MSIIGTLGSIFIDLRAGAANFESDMGRAARVAEQNSKKMQADAAKMGKAIGANLALFGTAASAAVVAAINRADQLDEMAQKVGASVKSLSRLEFAAGLEGIEDFTGSMVKLNRSVQESADKNSQQARAFEALGVKVTDANGKIRSTDAILIDVADSMSQYEDGVTKSAVATAIFGKSGADLIPFLNNGADGLELLAQRADQLGLTIDEKAAKAAGDFNDKLYVMKGAAQGLATRVAGNLLPVMDGLAEQMVDYATDAEAAATWTTAIERAMKGVIVTGIAIKATFLAAGNTIGNVAAAGARLTEGLSAGDLVSNPVGALAAMVARNGATTSDILKAGFADTTDQASRDMEAMANVMHAGARMLNEAASAVDKAAEAADKPRRQLNFSEGGQADSQQKVLADRAKALNDYNDALVKDEAQFAELVESMQTAETRAKAAYTRTRQVILDNTQEGTKVRDRLILQAEEKLVADLTQIHTEAAEKEQEALRNRLELQQRMREEADRGLRNDPLAAAFGINSLEDLERAMDPVKAAALGMGDALHSAFSRAADSSAAMLTNIILFGEEGEISAKRVAQALIQDTVQGLVRVGLQMAANFIASKIFGTASTATAAAQASGLAAAWAPAAVSASIATLGSASLAGVAGYIGGLSTAVAASAAAATTGSAVAIGGGRMNGGPVYRDTLHPIVEQGHPELLRQGGNYYLASKANGGMVSPAKAVVPVPSAANAGGMVVENYAPGLVFTPRGNVLTVEMIPELMQLVDEDQAARTMSGRGRAAQATARKLGAQQKAVR